MLARANHGVKGRVSRPPGKEPGGWLSRVREIETA